MLSQKIFEKVTKDVKVTAGDVAAYYKNEAQYRTPESRDVRHILIAEKKANDEVDFAEQDGGRPHLRRGSERRRLRGDRGELRGHGERRRGRSSRSRGQTAPSSTRPFELKEGAISQPMKTTYGYHVIEALSPVRMAKVTPLDESAPRFARRSSRKRTDAMTKWVEGLRDDYEDKVSYAEGTLRRRSPTPRRRPSRTSRFPR